MAARHGSTIRYRFGTFDVDPAARELRKNGERVKIQELPFRILVFLLERPRHVVTREELQRQLWPEGTFVEFEHGLNTAVKKLRQALEDDAENPRFIETVPRQGYRFVGAIEPPVVTQSKRRPRTIIAVILVLLAGVALWAFLPHPSEPAQQEAFLRGLRRLTADSGLTAEPAISPDGQLIAYSSDRGTDGNLDLWVMHARGGDPIRLTDNPADDREPDFCPDGRVVFRSDRDGGGIYMVPALGGNAVLLARKGRRPRCSPDGKRIAFWVGRERTFIGSSVFSVPSTGGSPTHIAPDLLDAHSPVWSPDGKFLLVYGHEHSKPRWFEADWWLTPVQTGKSIPLHIREVLGSRLALGLGVPPIMNWDVRTGEVLFSAAERIADPFATWRANLWSVQISTASKAAGQVRQLTTGSGKHYDASPALNGSLVFAELDLDPDILSVALDRRTGMVSGSVQPVLTDRNWQSRPVVSGDGAYMVFRTERDSGWEFWLKDLKTGHERPITISGGTKVWSVISRDGSKIAYHTSDAIEVADIKTGAVRVLCTGCKMRVADWSTTGNAVLVYNEEMNSFELLDINDGGRKEILRRSSSADNRIAKISPDGRWLAYGDDELRVARFDGNSANTMNEWKLTGFEVNEGLDWSPDSSLVYFLSTREGPMCLWSVRPGSHAPPSPVLHFHQRRRALLGGFAVAPDRLYFGVHETTGNIWIGKLREQ